MIERINTLILERYNKTKIRLVQYLKYFGFQILWFAFFVLFLCTLNTQFDTNNLWQFSLGILTLSIGILLADWLMKMVKTISLDIETRETKQISNKLKSASKYLLTLSKTPQDVNVSEFNSYFLTLQTEIEGRYGFMDNLTETSINDAAARSIVLLLGVSLVGFFQINPSWHGIFPLSAVFVIGLYYSMKLLVSTIILLRWKSSNTALHSIKIQKIFRKG